MSSQHIKKWLPILASSQLIKNKSEQRELLIAWTGVVEYE